MKTWEWNKIYSELTKVRVELTREANAASHTGHACRAKVVKISVGWGGQLQGTEADVVKGLVVHTHALVGVLDKLVNGKGGVVWLDNGVGHLWDGTTEKVSITRSGYSSRILEIRSVPIPAPVPPPREWVSWKPWRQSQDSASLRTTSRTESISSAPSV